MKVYAKNPAELIVLSNPSEPTMKKETTTTTTRKRRRRTRRNPAGMNAKQIKEVFFQGALVTGGLMVGTQVAKMAAGFIPAKQKQLKQLVAVLSPLAVGAVIVAGSNKKELQLGGVGIASSGVFSAIKIAAPTLKMIPIAGELANELVEEPAGYVPQEYQEFADYQELEGDSGYLEDGSQYEELEDESGYLEGDDQPLIVLADADGQPLVALSDDYSGYLDDDDDDEDDDDWM